MLSRTSGNESGLELFEELCVDYDDALVAASRFLGFLVSMQLFHVMEGHVIKISGWPSRHSAYKILHSFIIMKGFPISFPSSPYLSMMELISNEQRPLAVNAG